MTQPAHPVHRPRVTTSSYRCFHWKLLGRHGRQPNLPSVPSPDALRALVRHHIEDGFNRGDWTVCETTLADDYTARYGADGEANVGRDHYVRVCRFLRQLVPGREHHDRGPRRRGRQDRDAVTERGTLTGRAFFGIEPDGQQYAKPGTTVYRVVDGRLAESWGVEDTLGWFRQLGVALPPGGAGEPTVPLRDPGGEQLRLGVGVLGDPAHDRLLDPPADQGDVHLQRAGGDTAGAAAASVSVHGVRASSRSA